MENENTQLENFHRLSRSERLRLLGQARGLDETELNIITGKIPFSLDIAEHLIENVVGYFPIPLGIATHFRIDDREVLIPMAVEESSIIAAASATAKWIKKTGEIRTFSRGRQIIGQIQIPHIKNRERARKLLLQNREHLIDVANSFVPNLTKRGGGIQDIILRNLPEESSAVSEDNQMLVIHILCDPCDAMGANIINQVCESLKPRIEFLTGEKVGLCILSNLVDTKLVRAEVILRNIEPTVGVGIQEATHFAKVDPYRAATHNKGVLNGIDPILIVTGNDWRAVEAGIHTYASRSGKYQPVTDWKYENGDLIGSIEAPIAVGVVGGVTRIHPTAKIALKILGVKQADELARICAAVGLVQNLGALKALSTVGIVKGHMQLHASNLAIAAGAEMHEVARVRDRLADVLGREKRISISRAREILEAIRGQRQQQHLHF